MTDLCLEPQSVIFYPPQFLLPLTAKSVVKPSCVNLASVISPDSDAPPHPTATALVKNLIVSS